MTTLDLRGRDLIITPPANLLTLPTPELLDTLFGVHLPAAVHANMGRDKRYHFLRTQPIHFSAVKQALRQQQTPFTVAFDERPELPFSTSLGIEPRPYQLVPLLMALKLDPVRLLIADDVGIGKTIEACLAVRELIDRGDFTAVYVPAFQARDLAIALESHLKELAPPRREPALGTSCGPA